MTLLETHLLSGALIITVAILGLTAAQIVRKRLLRTLKSQERLSHERRQQASTLIEVVGWGIAVVIIGAAILMLLSDFGIDITPLLASAGVAGLALSLGVQTFIKDLIGGFFVLVENQYAVGDTIEPQIDASCIMKLSTRIVQGTQHGNFPLLVEIRQ